VSDARLSAVEASYLSFEQPGRPIHVGAVALFEGAPLLDGRGRLRVDAVCDLVAARCDQHPQLRQRLSASPGGFDRPRWTPDLDFDVARHVEEIHLEPPGDEDALREVAAEVHTRLLDDDHPLWHLCFVTGLADGRVGLIDRAHHALVDGVGGVDLAAAFLDLDRDGTPAAPPPGGLPAEGGAAALDTAVGGTLRASAQLARSVADAVQHPTAALRSGAGLLRGLATLVGEGMLAPSSSINTAPGEGRRFVWIRTRLDDVKVAGRSTGATVNDVVLAAVTTGLRSLLVERGEPLPVGLELKALVPVSVRGADEAGTLGNRVTAIVASLPVGLADPDRRLARIVASTRRLKARGEAGTLGALLDAADAIPAPVARVLVRSVRHQPFVNLVVTNVPGPPLPLYLLGAELLEAFPLVPLSANLSIGVAILSYNGALTISLNADADACPDVGVLAAGIEQGLHQLGVGVSAAAVAPAAPAATS